MTEKGPYPFFDPSLDEKEVRPLFRRDGRSAAVIGRHARLELAFGCRRGRTVLTHAYAEPPFRIGRCFDAGGAAYLIVACTGPGVFAGDSLCQRVTVENGARVLLASQSALQVHPADRPDPAVVHHEYQVARGGELHCHWDPVIPFAGARLVQRFDIQLAPGSRLYWSDALMSGRASRGEMWQFESIDHELSVLVDRSLEYLERYRLAPASRRVRDTWMAGEANYLATTIVHHDEATPSRAEELQRELASVAGVTAGIDVVTPGLMIGRFLGPSGVAIARARMKFRDLALASISGTPGLVIRR